MFKTRRGWLSLSFKHLLTLVGQRLSARQLLKIQSSVNYLRMGQHLAKLGFWFNNRVLNREEVWSAVAQKVASQRVLYLEFGVAGGESMRYWAGALKHPESILHGFDSFEGLPESGGHWEKGQFSMGGQAPDISDPRVRFFKGWFDQVLPTYSVPPHDLLIINLDADLYISTIFVLRYLRPHIKKGTFIYFDDMNHPDHEIRALEEFLNDTHLKFKPVCGDKSLTHMFFQCVA